MHYLTKPEEIRLQIAKFALARVLWLDTEVADWATSHPRLSLIQVLTDPTDSVGDSAYILDVLDRPEITIEFINQVIANPKIEKIFHNAGYDLNFLRKTQAQNITCTLKIARGIGIDELGVTNLKLKTLAVELCHFSSVDIEEQGSDWGKRSLTPKQLKYAAMDVVYLAAVHCCLLKVINQKSVSQSDTEIAFNGPVKFIGKSKAASLGATKVRIAFECPRLFYLHHKFHDKAGFLPPDVIPGVGNLFHHLADAFVRLALQESQFQQLFHSEAEQLNSEEVAAQMQHLFYILEFLPYLRRVTLRNPTRAPALLKVWQGLQGLIRGFAEILIVNRRYCSAEAVIRSTFIVGERKLKHEFTLPDGKQQRIIGEFDCLIYNFELHRLCVVELKTYQPADPAAQLAQVALYSYMLREKKEVPVDSAVYCVLPEFKEYSYSWEQLESTVHQLIPYKLQQMQQWLNWEQGQPNPPPPTAQLHLCEICPQRQKCQTFFIIGDNQSTPAIAQPHPKASPQPTKPEVVAPQEPAEIEKSQTVAETSQQEKKTLSIADGMGKDLVATLQSFGVSVDYQGAAIGPAFIRVKLKPHLGVRVNAILRSSDDLRVQLGLAYPPLIAPQAGYVSVDLPRPDRQVASFEHYIQSQVSPPTAPMQIAIGVDLEGKLVEADLSDPNTCHFLIGGTTGSGKSEFLRSLLLSLLFRHSPSQLKIALVDPKRVTFPEFEQMPWLLTPVVKGSDRAIALMTELVKEMKERYQRFETAGCADLNTYNQQAGHQSSKPLPRIVCIFDEYADFMAEKETRDALELSIKRLGAMTRAAGIHLIIATQRPEAKVVTPLIRSNLPGRVALRTASEADSKIVLGGDQTAAAYLLGKGDLLYQTGSQLLRLQSLFASKTVATQIQ